MEHVERGDGRGMAIVCNAPVLLCKLCEHLNAVNVLFGIVLLQIYSSGWLKVLLLIPMLHLLC